MATNDERVALWTTIRSEHPALAQALQAARRLDRDTVAIDAYPASTEGWVWSAIETQNPALAKLITEKMKPLKLQFEGPGTHIEVATEDLINALVANTRQVVKHRVAG